MTPGHLCVTVSQTANWWIRKIGLNTSRSLQQSQSNFVWVCAIIIWCQWRIWCQVSDTPQLARGKARSTILVGLDQEESRKSVSASQHLSFKLIHQAGVNYIFLFKTFSVSPETKQLLLIILASIKTEEAGEIKVKDVFLFWTTCRCKWQDRIRCKCLLKSAACGSGAASGVGVKIIESENCKGWQSQVNMQN